MRLCLETCAGQVSRQKGPCLPVSGLRWILGRSWAAGTQGCSRGVQPLCRRVGLCSCLVSYLAWDVQHWPHRLSLGEPANVLLVLQSSHMWLPPVSPSSGWAEAALTSTGDPPWPIGSSGPGFCQRTAFVLCLDLHQVLFVLFKSEVSISQGSWN